MKYIDLTHKINNNMSLFPGTEAPIIKKACDIKDVGCRVTRYTLDTHMGTHMDAPAHFYGDNLKLDDFDVSFFFGKAFVYDCSDKKIIDKGSLLQIEDTIKSCDFLLFYTGKQHDWGTKAYYNDLTGLSRDACEYLKDKDIRGIGIDSLSPDTIYGDPLKEGDLYVHHILLPADKVIIENLNNLDLIKNKIVDFTCLPIYIEDADGGQVRAVAKY